jgi:hypothetical protein
MADEPTKIFLGTVTLPDDGAPVALSLPADLNVEGVKAAIAAAEEARVAAEIAET